MYTVSTKILSFEEWQSLPETEQACEVMDGVLIMSPGASDDHQWVELEIAFRLSTFVKENRLGVVLTAPRDVLVQREPLRVRQPDILFISAEKSGVTSRPGPGRPIPLEIAPDLIVEIISPSNTESEMNEKLDDYRNIGVLEAWLARPESGTIEVIPMNQQETDTHVTFGPGEILRSSVLTELAVPVSEIFE